MKKNDKLTETSWWNRFTKSPCVGTLLFIGSAALILMMKNFILGIMTLALAPLVVFVLYSYKEAEE